MENMTTFQANFIKYLRLRLECTFGKVSAHYYNRYTYNLPFTNKENNVSSRYGRELCRAAQDLLKESWEDEC